MTLKIVTDSSCDLPQEIIQQYNITVIPLFINIGENSFRDGVDITRQEYYERAAELGTSPKTAAPGPEIFREAYQFLAANGATEIISIHISSKLSSLIENARAGASETTSVAVTVFDSRQLSLGTGFQVLSAAQAAESGDSLSEILAMLEEQISRTHVFAALDTLQFLQRSGRMNFAVSFIGSILQIKPLLKMYDGEPSSERVRTRQGAIRRLVELLKKYGPYEKAALLHSHAAARAETLLNEVRHLLPDGEIWVQEITPVLGAHIGPGVLGFVCISKK